MADDQVQATPSMGDPGEGDLQEAQAAGATQPQSRLGAIMQAVAKTVSTGLAGIPDSRRPSFVTGLGQGARAQKAAEATQQAIKFKNFDDQIRLAQLHNQDLKLQMDTQEQRDAHTKADLENRQLANSLGIKYDTIPSQGQAVIDHLTAQTAASGAASVPPGTHLSGDGESVNIPQNNQQTIDGQKQMYSLLAPALGLPSLPVNADFVPPQLMNMLTNKIHGYGIDGKPIPHQELPGAIGALEAQRDQLKDNGATPDQLKTVDNMLGIYKANLKALDAHEADVKAKQKQAELDVTNSPENVAAAAKSAAQKKQAELDVTNSPANQQKTAEGAALKTAAEAKAKAGPEWKPNVTSDEKKKAELAENMVFNANHVAAILQRRPELVGAVAGRITNVDQLKGSNDPDLVQLGTDIHNIAIANQGIHGMRSPEEVRAYETKVLNNFHNGPKGIAGGLMGSVKSVQTFIDNARPETYKTHTKNGGAIKSMVSE